MHREITNFSEIPKTFWVSQRIGRGYVYVEQERPVSLLNVPREIFLDAHGRNKATVSIDVHAASSSSESATGHPDSDPVADKRARLLAMPGLILHFVDSAALDALSGADSVPAPDQAGSGLSAAMLDEQRALLAIRTLVETDQAVLDLELGLDAAPEPRAFAHSVRWLRSLDIDLAHSQVETARHRMLESATKAFLQRARESAERYAIVDAKFSIVEGATGSGTPGRYLLEHTHCDHERLGKTLLLKVEIPREGILPAAQELYRSRSTRLGNRALALGLLGILAGAGESNDTMAVTIRPIAVFTRG